MKCDHLIGRTFDGDVYILASDVMEAIAELKEFAEDACLERDDNQTAIDELQAENAELKQKLESVQASMYCDVVDANMENRRLRRALYKACANWAHHRVFVRLNTNEKAWENVERKCREKAESYL